MEEAYFSTELNGEIRYNDKRTKSIDSSIEMMRSWINIFKTCTLEKCEKELERLIKLRKAYEKEKMKELSEKRVKPERMDHLEKGAYIGKPKEAPK